MSEPFQLRPAATGTNLKNKGVTIMKSFQRVIELFFFLGIVFLIVAIILAIDAHLFLNKSIQVEGEIIDVRIKRIGDLSIYPIIRFTDMTGNTIVFESNTSIRGRGLIGNKVPVRYLSENPEKARIATFFSIWGGAVVLGIMGVVMSVMLFWLSIKESVDKKRAKTYSRVIIAKIKKVELNTKISINGQSPYRIIAQWLNPETNQVHIFKSKNIWFDPSDYTKDENVVIKADWRNPKKYWMDMSFLPQETNKKYSK